MQASPDRDRTAPLERLLRQDRWIVLGGVFLVVAAAAWYTVVGIGMNMSAVEMTRMARTIGAPMDMGLQVRWSPGYAVLIFFMWWVMMIAMMTPSAAPTVLLYSALKRHGTDRGSAALLSGLFLLGYLLAWAGFSIAATAAQFGLEQAGLSDGAMMTIRSSGFAGLMLMAAGAYQFSALKSACLRYCQSPAHFLARHRRPGRLGAVITGACHGLYCLGCCWALMALLFVGGVMNLYWIVGIALYVAAEKLLIGARWFAPLTGAALLGFGLYLCAASFGVVG